MEKAIDELEEIEEMNEITESIKTGSMSRAELLNILSNGARIAYTHATKDRIRDPKTYKLRLDSIHALSHVASVAAGVLEDLDLSDAADRLDILEQRRKEEEEAK